MARLRGTLGTSVLFFVSWLVVAISPVAAWDGPGFLVARPSWQRLYWEAVPLVMTLVLTVMFVRFVDSRGVRLPMVRRPGRDSILGLGVLWIGTVAGVRGPQDS